MPDIRFTKLQGLGNDFLIIFVEEIEELRSSRVLARKMCERNYGAGADGLVFVTRARHADADFASLIFNSDGSEAEISGNGTRCVAAYVYHSGLWKEPQVRIATAAGVKTGRLVGRDGLRYEFEFEMGWPRLSSVDIPISLDPPLPRVVAHPLRLGGDLLEVTCVSMGNPHCTLFVPELDEAHIAEIGPLIEDHPAFPRAASLGVNDHLVSVPRFHGGEETPAVMFPHADIAGAEAGRLVRVVTR